MAYNNKNNYNRYKKNNNNASQELKRSIDLIRSAKTSAEKEMAKQRAEHFRRIVSLDNERRNVVAKDYNEDNTDFAENFDSKNDNDESEYSQENNAPHNFEDKRQSSTQSSINKIDKVIAKFKSKKI
ncbi:MAG: hypothetical protein JJV93_02035 [Alphaproteobacteria bacterium]|nr:hypothetical protein [Alphaproteobacteria bacterium]MBL0718020.1 hypothetical protein [Alphaproteobacteria bacterium]